MPKFKHSLYCTTCGKDVFDNPLDYYMLRDEVWAELCENGDCSSTWLICKECGEKFLGRKFRVEDMKNAPINYEYAGPDLLPVLKMDIYDG